MRSGHNLDPNDIVVSCPSWVCPRSQLSGAGGEPAVSGVVGGRGRSLLCLQQWWLGSSLLKSSLGISLATDAWVSPLSDLALLVNVSELPHSPATVKTECRPSPPPPPYLRKSRSAPPTTALPPHALLDPVWQEVRGLPPKQKAFSSLSSL